MRVTYIGHSGFSVELESHILLFDYYEGTMPEFDPAKKLLVFASHSHPDHFNREILETCGCVSGCGICFPEGYQNCEKGAA
ncbi:MAG: MBL fold metallo-hydrolase [Coprococcus sp.]